VGIGDKPPPLGDAECREKRKGMWWGRGHLHRLTVFIRHENVVRLLEFLGHRQDE
jgi:hypothetical protein